MKTFVLSLPTDRLRKSILESQFPCHFPYFEIVDAIDGRTKQVNTDIPACKKDKRRPLTSTEVACALGHIKIYEEIKKYGNKENNFNLILEDDIQGSPDDLEKIQQLSSFLPKKSIIILGGLGGMQRAQNLYGYLSPWPNIYRVPKPQRRNLSGTCCYLLDTVMAEHLLDKQNICLHRADDWPALLKNERNVFYTPLLSHPTPNIGNSHIEKERARRYSGGIIKRWYRDGCKESFARPITRISTPILAPFFGLYRINHNIKSNK